jgi:hypothetical protein
MTMGARLIKSVETNIYPEISNADATANRGKSNSVVIIKATRVNQKTKRAKVTNPRASKQEIKISKARIAPTRKARKTINSTQAETKTKTVQEFGRIKTVRITTTEGHHQRNKTTQVLRNVLMIYAEGWYLESFSHPEVTWFFVRM